MAQKLKDWLNFLLRSVISVGLLWMLFSGMQDKEKMVELIKTADLVFIGYGLLIFFVIHCLLVLRWRIFMDALELDVPWMNMLRYFFLGLFGNLFLPSAIGGDVIKTVGLCVNAQQKPKIVASVLLDRLSGFAGMVLVSCVALAFGFRLMKHPLIWITVGGMGLTLLGIGCVLFNEKLYRFFCQAFHFFPKLKNAVMEMHYDIALLRDRKIALVKAILLSSFGQVLLALTFFCLARALHQDTLAVYFILFTPITCVASSFPSIGGLGFREGALEFLLTSVGVVSGVGISIGLLDFLFMAVVGVLGWIFFVFTKNQG